MKRPVLALSVASAIAVSLPASAVYLNPDGIGQALVFPYYTVQSSGTNPFNTYVTIVNHTNDAKALRVRLRESRNSREVTSFNLFLSPNDAWAGVVIPMFITSPPRIVALDRSCTNPRATATVEDPPGFPFATTFFTGAFADGNGATIDRTNEGWVEVIEMATLTGASATAVTHGATGLPTNCTAVEGNNLPSVAAPTGGLSGTLTLINVASGMDFTVNAEALADLGTRPFYRLPTDAYPDFNANEIDPITVVATDAVVYRSLWNRPVDAVSAAFMRSQALTEFVLDAGTRSRTDVVVTFPTRQHYVTTVAATAPFTSPGGWAANCTSSNTIFGESVEIDAYDREENLDQLGNNGFGTPPPPPRICGAASIMSFTNRAAAYQADGALGSVSRGFYPFSFGAAAGSITVRAATQNGWARILPDRGGTITSLATSTRTNIATGITTTGAHAYNGLPMAGLTVRTFENGTLTCGAGSCQGNYGGSFPLKFQRSITPGS